MVVIHTVYQAVTISLQPTYCMIVLSHNKESASHENDQPQKEILSYFELNNRDWVTGKIGAPPFDVSGVAYLLHGMVSFDKLHQLESTSPSSPLQ